jgi:hypothetical protein
MPQVPTDFVQSVFPQGQQAYNTIDRANPDNFGAQVGQTLDQAGNILHQNALQRQQLANETNVNDVYANQFSPAARDIYQNYMKLGGKDAEAQFPAFQQQMNELREQVRGSLPNMMQQKAFDEASTRRVEMDLDGMARYGAAQTKEWQWNTHNAVINNLATDGAAHFNDPGRLQANQDEIDRQTINFGATHGWSEDQTKSEMGKNQAKLWSAVIERQAVYNPLQAQQILDAKTKDGTLPGDAQVKLQEKLKPQMEMLQSQSAYGKITGGATAQAIGMRAQQQGIDPSLALTVWSAEGGVTNPAAKNPVSSATGHFQIIDSTWKDLGGTDQDRLDSGRQIDLGLQNIKQTTSALTRDLGRQPRPWEVYLGHQQGIQGAQALLHADPNASAASVVGSPDAITNNMPGATKDTTVGQFNNFMQGYVQKHSQMYDSTGVPTAQNLSGNWEQHRQQLVQQAAQDNPNDPALADRYLNHYEQKYGQIIDAQKKVETANWRVVENALTGPQAFESKDQFLADPATKAAYDAIYERDHSLADKVDKIFTDKNLGLWDPSPTPESDSLAGSLRGYAREDEEHFAAMDLHPYLGAMPKKEWDQLSALQTRIQDGDAAERQKSIRINKVLANSQDLIGRVGNSLYKDQTPFAGANKAGSNQQQLKWFRFRDAIEQNLIDFVANNGRAPSYTEQRQIVTQVAFPNGLVEPQARTKPGVPGAPAAQPTAQPAENAQPQIDFSNFKPENQDAQSQAIARELQANGKIVDDDTITAVKALLAAKKTKGGE